MDALEETADFLEIISELFNNAHHVRVKNAYCEILVELLEPVAAVALAEVNVPVWMGAVESIYTKSSKLLGKPRHQSVRPNGQLFML